MIVNVVVVVLVVALLQCTTSSSSSSSSSSGSSSSSTMSKRISIIGGGMTGLSIACHLIEKIGKGSRLHIDIYDSRKAGQALASSVAAGLMHPLSPKGALIWKGEKGYEKTRALLDTVQGYSGDKKLYSSDELLIRPFSKTDELEQYKKSSLKIPHWIQMVDANEMVSLLGSHAVADTIIGGAIIKNSININCPLYLESMWGYINHNSNANWIAKDIDKEEFTSLFDQNDVVIAACSTGITKLHDVNENDRVLNRLKYVRGQNIYIRMNENDKMNNIINGRYVVCKELDHYGKVYLCGATYEYMEDQQLYGPPNVDIAKGMLIDKLSELNQDLKHREVIGANAGVRLTTIKSKHGKIPFIRRHQSQDHVWFVGGFGSHGLIHHSLVAEVVAESALTGSNSNAYPELYEYDPELIPLQV